MKNVKKRLSRAIVQTPETIGNKTAPPGLNGFHYKAFISYSWSDRKWGEWLHHALETYRAPKSVTLARRARSLHPIFKDREEEAAGASIGASIEAAMANSEFLIVLCSPRSAASQWVNREVAWFKTHRDPRKILTVIVDGEPMASTIPGREAEECFPKTLLYRVNDNLLPTEVFEAAPLAADARDSGDGKRGAKLKLAAALLGVGLDTLVNRDNRRRALRRRIAFAGLASLSVILGGLSMFAFNQRDAARIAQDAAELQRDKEQRLVEYMLTDLREKLNAVGRLDILESVGQRLSDSYAEQELATLDADELGRRARVQLLLGEVDNTRGDLDAALARYKEAAATTEELLKRNPSKAQQIFDHAQSVFWVGYIAWQRGDAAEAKKYFTQYKDYSDQLVAIDPENEDWQMEVKYALNNLGTLAMDQGEAASAERYFQKSLDVVTQLNENDPGNVDRILSKAQAYAWLADALYLQMKLTDAHDARRAEIALYAHALAIDTYHVETKVAAINANVRLSEIAIATNQLEAALKYSLSAADAANTMLALEPESTERLDRASRAQTVLGEAYIHNSRIAEAEAALTAAIGLGEKLTALDGSVVLWKQKILTQPQLDLARVLAAGDAKVMALNLFDKVATELSPLSFESVSDPIVLRRLVSAQAGRARLSNKFEKDWYEIVELLEAHSGKHGPETLTILAEAYLRTAKLSEARSIATRLYTAGYRHPDFLALLEEYPALKAALVGDAVVQ